MGERRHAGEGRPLGARDASAGEATRRMTLERQKEELRRERDEVLLALEQDLGDARLAELFGLGEGSLERLLSGARERQRRREPDLGAADGADISVRRIGARRRVRLAARSGYGEADAGALARGRRVRRGATAMSDASVEGPPRIVERREHAACDPARWAELDSYYEALGRSSRIG